MNEELKNKFEEIMVTILKKENPLSIPTLKFMEASYNEALKESEATIENLASTVIELEALKDSREVISKALRIALSGKPDTAFQIYELLNDYLPDKPISR